MDRKEIAEQARDEVQWNGRGFPEGPPKWLLDAIQGHGNPANTIGTAMRMRDEVHIGTRYGVMVAMPGDWIVRLPDGEMFVQTDYERALSTPSEAG